MIFQLKHGHQRAQSEGLSFRQSASRMVKQCLNLTIYVTFWNRQSDNHARFTQQLARYEESKFQLLSQALFKYFHQLLKHHGCLWRETICTIIPICATTKTHKRHWTLGERPVWQKDAARKRLWQQAFSLTFEAGTLCELVCSKHTEKRRTGTHRGCINCYD